MNNEVKIVLGLDDSKARGTIKSFFAEFNKSKVTDPLKGVDASFEKVKQSAEQLGYAWDQTTGKFKNSQGVYRSVNELKGAISSTAKAAVDGGTSFDRLSQAFRKLDQEGKAFSTSGQTAAQAMQGVAKGAGAAQQGVSGLKLGAVAQQLKGVGDNSKTAGSGLKTLGSDAGTLRNSLQGIGEGAKGIKQVGSEATGAKGKLSEVNAETKRTKQGLDGIKGSQGLKQVGLDAKGSSAQAGELSTKIKLLGTNLNQAGASSRSLAPLKATLGGVSTNANTSAVSVGKVGRAILDAGRGSNQLSAIPKSFSVLGTSARAAQKPIEGVKRKLKETGQEAKGFSGLVQSSFNNILQGIPQGIGLAIGQVLIAPLRELAQVAPQAIAEFNKIDESIRLTLSIVGESSGKFDQLQQSILGVSSVTAATAQEVGEVAQSLARAGFSLTEVDAALEGIVKGAEATGTSYGDMGRIIVSALGAFGLAASDAADVADTLTVAANGANTDVLQLGDALKYVGPVAKTVGQNLQDTNLQLQVLANSGIQASTAGTSLRTILTNLQIAAGGAGEEFTALSRGSARSQKALALMGAEMVDANGDLKTGAELIAALRAGMENLDTGERAIISKVLAGSEGLPALSALINATEEDVAGLAEAMDGRMGAAADTAEQALAGISGSFKLLESNLSAALVSIGGVIAMGLKPLVDIATAVLSALNGLPGPIKGVAVALGVLGAAVGAVVVTMNTLKGTIVATFAANSIQAITNFAKALTASNIQATISGMVSGFKTLSTVVRGQLITGLVQATNVLNTFTTALKNGTAAKVFSDSVTALSKGFRSLGTAGQATQLTLDFAGAAKKGTGSATGLSKTLPGLSGLMSALGIKSAAASAGIAGTATATQLAIPGMTGMGAAGTAAAAGATATGTAAAAATPAVAGLGASIGAFAIAAAPVAAVVGAVALGFVYLKDRVDAYNQITKPLEESTNTITDSLEQQGEQVGGMGVKFESWGKAIEDALGPLDKLLNLTGPIYQGIKLIAEGLGRLNEWDRANQQVMAASKAYMEFQGALAASNNKIEENRAKMAQLNPTSSEFGRLAAENTKLVTAQKTAIEQRIKALDGQIAKLKENEGANGRQIAALEKAKLEYEAQIPVIDANVKLLREEEKANEDLTGKVKNFTAAMAEAAIAREEANSKADTKVYQTEIKALNDVKEGLISEAEARAINAKAALEASDEKIQAVNKEIAELQEMYDVGGITQKEYQDAVGAATKGIEEEIKKRGEAENNYAKAVAQAVDAALQEYDKLVQGIGTQVNLVNNMLGEIGNIGSSGISAFRALADSITDYRIAGLGKEEQAAMNSIDRRHKREKERADKLGADSALLDKKQAAEKERLEKQFASKKRQLMQEQVDFEAQAIKLQIASKEAELKLWYAQQKVANEIAVQQAEIAVLSAKANGGSPEQIASLEKIVGLTKQQGSFLETAFSMKGKLLDIEALTAKQQLNTKAAAEGVTSEFGGQVTSLSAVKRAMSDFAGQVDKTRDNLTGIRSGLDPIPDRAAEVAQEVRNRIEQGVSETSFEAVAENFRNGSMSPELARLKAREIVDAYDAAGTQAGDIASNNIAGRFGDTIPAELIKNQLVSALALGADISIQEATTRFEGLGAAIPTEQVARILGRAVGGGAEEGMRILQNTPLPPGVFRGLGTQLSTEVQTGAQQANSQLAASLGQAGAQSITSFKASFIPGLNSAIQAGDAIFSLFGSNTSTVLEQGISGGLNLGIQGGLVPVKEGLDQIVQTAIGQRDPIANAYRGAFELVGNIGETFGGKTGRDFAEGLLAPINPTMEQLGDAVGQGLANTVTASVVPNLQRIEEEYGVFGKSAAFLFGEENVAGIASFLEPVSNAVTNIFGNATEAAGEGGTNSGQAFGEALMDQVTVVDQFADTVGKKFGDMIPKEELIDQLRISFSDGTVEGMNAAEKRIAELPDAIPRDEVAALLGEGLENGVEIGQAILDNYAWTSQTLDKLEGDAAGALTEGGQEGAQGIEEQVKNSNIRNTIKESISQGSAEGMSAFTTNAQKAGSELEGVFTKAGADSAKSFSDIFLKQTDKMAGNIEKQVGKVKFDGMKQELTTSLQQPIEAAAEAIGKISLGDGATSGASALSDMATTVAGSGLANELRGAAGSSKSFSSSSRTAASYANRLATSWQRAAAAAERAARAAARAGTGRWAGGPVSGGQTYTVNEMGKEMFMSKSGSISEIKAPAFGQWRAPSSGDVIPAHIASQIRSATEARQSISNIEMLQAGSPAASRPSSQQQGGGLQTSLVRELKKLGGASGAVTNNVSISSASPVQDVTKVMTDLARLRAMRRR